MPTYNRQICSIFVLVQNKKNIFLKRFGENVRKHRKLKKLSQKDLAHLCDVEISQISRIERGAINTKIFTTHIIAEALEINHHDLFLI